VSDLLTHPFWARLQRFASEPDSGAQSLWSWLRAKLDLALYRPEAAPDVVVSELVGRDGPYYMLKSSSAKTYYRLGARDFFLWEQMDGSRSVKDLVVAYFMQHGTFAYGRVARLVSGLKAGSFLTDKPVSVYQQAQEQLQRRRAGYRLMRVAGGFMQQQFAIGGLDRVLAGLYRWGGRLLFIWPLQILYIILTLAGIYLFVGALRGGRYSLVVTASGSYTLGLVILAALLSLSVLVHELAHALTVKHYGREVREAGAMIYFGFPGFFVDTTDIWLEGKRARLAVSWAGPYSGLVLAGAAVTVMTLWPTLPLNGVLYRFAFMSYMLVFFNLNPLLNLDGYYLLMDSLEIPMLRSKSLAFLRAGLPAKVRQLRRGVEGKGAGLDWLRGLGALSREERIFTLFGLLSALWTVYAIYLGLTIWQSRLAASLRTLFAGQASGGGYLLAAFLALLSSVFLFFMLNYPFRLLLGAVRSAAQRGVFANTWRLAALLLVLVVGLVLASHLSQSRALSPAVGFAALLATLYLAGRNAVDYAGSRFSPASASLGLAALAWLVAGGLRAVSEVMGMEGGLLPGATGPVILQGLELLALLALLAAAAVLLASTGLKQIGAGAWALTALVVVLAAGLTVYRAGGLDRPPAGRDMVLLAEILLPTVGLGLLVPSLFSFWRAASGPAWVALALTFGWLGTAALLDLSLVPAYLLLACALALYSLALSQIRFRVERRTPTIDLDDGHRLQRAFSWTAVGIFWQTSEIAGGQQARLVAESFTRYTNAAHWPIQLAAGEDNRGRVLDGVPEDSSLIERGETYAASLNLLLDLATRVIGAPLTLRALQGTYDHLPWEEREIAAQYLFLHVDQARALSREFAAIHRDYAALVCRVPLFATMSDEETDLLLARLRLERHPAGRRIIRQGDRGDRFYIVRRGHVEVTQRDVAGVTRVVNQLDRGDYFGELALLHDAPRNATCRATVPTETLALSRQDFDRLVRSRLTIRGKLSRSLARAELLRQLPLFAELDGLQIQEVAAQLKEKHLETGTVFIRQGEIGEEFYVIEHGQVQVFVTENGAEQVVAERGPGEYVGEIALLLEVPRTASVRTLAPTRLLALSRQDFEQLVHTQLQVSQRLERETSRRMIDLDRLGAADRATA
jgi:putative peptide zinc metalloprotease protein